MVKPRTLITSLAMTAILALPAVSASAIGGGPWASASSPIKNMQAGGKANMGEAYGTWQGYREDQGRGSRIQDSSRHRNPGGNFGQRGAYVKTTWYFNANRCYVSSFSTSGGSAACSSGWWGSGSTNTSSTNSKSWQYRETWKYIDPRGQAGRGQMRVCQDYVASPDLCGSTQIVRGNSY